MKVIDIRKMHAEQLINKLVDASKIETKWWGKRTDNYWSYLDNNTERIDVEIDANVMADLFVYIFDTLKHKELLSKYSTKISANRNGFVMLIVLEDADFLLNIFTDDSFLSNFYAFLKELNGEFFHYERTLIEETITSFTEVLNLTDNDFALIINIG